MHYRLKELRKALGLTQAEFGDRIHIKQNTIAQYEMGRTTPSDQCISYICDEFAANEEWLRTGDGPMFSELDREAQLAEWVGKVLGSESEGFKKKFIRMLMSLSEKEWEFLEKKAKELADDND